MSDSRTVFITGTFCQLTLRPLIFKTQAFNVFVKINHIWTSVKLYDIRLFLKINKNVIDNQHQGHYYCNSD
nr:MAG TPA: hypothetical protein [Caudoviricetes sp.]